MSVDDSDLITSLPPWYVDGKDKGTASAMQIWVVIKEMQISNIRRLRECPTSKHARCPSLSSSWFVFSIHAILGTRFLAGSMGDAWDRTFTRTRP